MYFTRKLRQDFSIAGFIPAILCLSIGALIWIFISARAGVLSVAVFFVLYAGFSLWIYVRTRNLGYLAASVWQMMFGLYLATRSGYHLFTALDPKVRGLIIFFLLGSTVWLFYMFFTKRAKWKGREVFELASLSAEPVPDGFTERPRYAGKADYTKDELTGFARFLNSNLVAMPYFDKNQVVFVPVKMDDEFGCILRPGSFRQSRSWVAFDYAGNVTANISRRDYMEYREKLSFDQLCENLGKLFIDFMAHYRRGEAERIIYMLNELGLGPVS